MEALDKFDELTLKNDQVDKLLEIVLGLVFRIEDMKIFKHTEKFDLLVQLETMLQLIMEKNQELHACAEELYKLCTKEDKQKAVA
jgi:hypothetical protein